MSSILSIIMGMKLVDTLDDLDDVQDVYYNLKESE